MRTLAGLLPALFLVATSHFTMAQEVSRAEQARMAESTTLVTPGLREGAEEAGFEAVPPTPGDDDLGEQWILRQEVRHQPFLLFGEASGFYTSNAALARRNEINDWIFLGQVGASYQPKFSETLAADITVRQGFFRYNDLSVLDFDSFNAGAGVTWVATRLWDLAFFARYNYNRLTDTDEGDEFFRNHTATVGVQKVFLFTKSHYAFAGWASQFGWADPHFSERDEHGIFAGYHADLTRHLSGDIFYRLAWFDYAIGRNDLNQMLSAALTYRPWKWVSVNASLSVAMNRSDRAVFDYNVLNAGGGVAVQIRF